MNVNGYKEIIIKMVKQIDESQERYKKILIAIYTYIKTLLE